MADGVTTAEQLDRLRERGWQPPAAPMSIGELTAWLAARPALPQV